MTENNSEKREHKRDEKGRFVKGTVGGPGRKKGTRDFITDFMIACREVAKAVKLKKDPDQIKIELIKRGIKEGLAGKFPFWEKLIERVYGKVPEQIELTETQKLVVLDDENEDETN